MQEMLNTLARRSFAACRVRNLIAVLAIALCSTLFTSITAIGIGTLQSITLMMQEQKMSRSDGDFRYMSKEQFEMMKGSDLIREAGLRMPVGFLTNARLHNIEFDVMDETQAELTFCMPVHGEVPRRENEVVASDKALRDLGVEPQVGAQITVAFTAHGRDYTFPMVVSGWYEALNDQLSVMWTGLPFRDANPDIFRNTYNKDFEMAGTYWSDILAVSRAGLQEKMTELARSMGGDPEDMGSPDYLPAVVNAVTNPVPDPQLLVMGAVFVALFIFCGYLLIYNVFDIAVMQEIRRFGLYRTIGMSRKQVKKLMNRQALWLSLMGIPLGLFAGFLIGKPALPLIMGTFSTEYQNIRADVTPSPVIFASAALLTALTVMISTRKPVRKAADTPPIDAFRYVEGAARGRKSRRSADLARIPRLAWFNLGRNRRRSAFIVISLMLCIVLMNCSGTAAESMDIEKQTAYMIRTDFAVVNAVSTSNMKGFVHRTEALKPQTVKDISSQPGVVGGAPVYKNTAEDDNVTFDFGHKFAEATFVNNHSGLVFGSDEEGRSFGLGKDGRMVCNVYGMEESAIARMDLREGIMDAHTLYEKMEEGEGVLAGVQVNRTDMSLHEVFDMVQVGEVITVYKDGLPFMELPVLAKAAINGDDLEIGFTCNGVIQIGGDSPYLYLPSSVYKELYDDPAVYKYAFDVEEGYQEDMAAFLDNYRENVDSDINYLSSQTAVADAEGERDMILFVGRLMGIIFGIAGILNLINTVITSIVIRRHEFATMQSIGMTGRQLTGMMIAESVFYAVGACLSGLLMAAILNLTLVKEILDSQWQFTFHFTLIPALLAGTVMILVSVLVPVLALRVFYKESIVEQLRAAE